MINVNCQTDFLPFWKSYREHGDCEEQKVHFYKDDF